MLAIESLRVRYGRIDALRGVSLHVEAGEIVGLIGPNGAGKTTTLAAVMGLLAPAGGRVVLDGRPLSGTPTERIVRSGVSLVPEGRRIFSTLTVEENLRMGAMIHRATADAAIDRVCERFPILGRYRAAPAGKLSGGEQQQLAIARALLTRPRLLLLDEPSLGLAPLMVNLVFETLEELRGEGVTVLLVEQNARRTLRFADRTYILRNGGIELETTREDARSELAEAVFLGFES